jgi:transposase
VLSARKQLLVVNLYEELGSYRAVAAVVGCDHKTVKAHVERVRADQRPGRARRASVADPFAYVIGTKLAATEGRITAKALLRVVRAAGYEGSSRTLRRAVADARAEWRLRGRRVYRPWQSAPGDVVVVDWGHVGTVPTAAGPRPLSAFCAVLGWSRYRYVRFTTSQRFAALATGLAGCFEHVQGVPARVLFDNPKTVTSQLVCRLSVLNADLVRLATHYTFTPITAAPADPESKGKVESLVKFVKSDCVPADGFASLDDANRWAEQWCAEVNGEIHSETCAVPAERLVAERSVLRPLRERPPVATGERRRVDKFSTVRYASARYSVPHRLRGEWLEVAVEGNAVRISSGGDEVALHPLQPPGGSSIVDDHYPSTRPNGVRPLRPRTVTEHAFCALGPAAEAYLRAAAAAGASRLPRLLDDVLALERSHGREAVVAGLQRAVAFRRFGTEDLRSILAAGTAVPPARTAPAALIALADVPSVPRRPVEAYAWLS